MDDIGEIPDHSRGGCNLAGHARPGRRRGALAARDPSNVVWQTDLVVSAWKLASAGAPEAARHANGLAILKRLHAEGRLTADQEGWIAIFEAALREPDEETAEEAKPDAPPWWKFWRG